MVTIIGATQRSLAQQRVNIVNSSGTVIDTFGSTDNVPSGATKKCYGTYVNSGGGALNDIYTPTGGTTLYVQDMLVYANALMTFKVGDNVTLALVSGTNYANSFVGVIPANTSLYIHFDKPLPVATKLNIYDANAGGKGLAVSFMGWEI